MDILLFKMKGKIASVYDNLVKENFPNFLPCFAFDINFLLVSTDSL